MFVVLIDHTTRYATADGDATQHPWAMYLGEERTGMDWIDRQAVMTAEPWDENGWDNSWEDLHYSFWTVPR